MRDRERERMMAFLETKSSVREFRKYIQSMFVGILFVFCLFFFLLFFYRREFFSKNIQINALIPQAECGTASVHFSRSRNSGSAAAIASPPPPRPRKKKRLSRVRAILHHAFDIQMMK